MAGANLNLWVDVSVAKAISNVEKLASKFDTLSARQVAAMDRMSKAIGKMNRDTEAENFINRDVIKTHQKVIEKLEKKIQTLDWVEKATGRAEAATRRFANGMVTSIRQGVDETTRILKTSLLVGWYFGQMVARSILSDMYQIEGAFYTLNRTLQADMKETEDLIRGGVKRISNTTGTSQEGVFSMTETILSSGFGGKRGAKTTLYTGQKDSKWQDIMVAEGEKGYDVALKNLLWLSQMYGIQAQATGQTPQQYLESVSRLSSTTGLDFRDAAQGKVLFAMIKTLKDIGVGSLEENSLNYAKIAPQAKIAGVPIEEALGFFAEMTRSVSPQEAGNITRTAISQLAVPKQTITQTLNKIKWIQKWKWAFTITDDPELNKAQERDREKFKTLFPNEQSIASLLFDEKGNTKSLWAFYGGVLEKAKGFETGIGQRMFIESIFNSMKEKQGFGLIVDSLFDKDTGRLTEDITTDKLTRAESAVSQASKNSETIYDRAAKEYLDSYVAVIDTIRETWRNFLVTGAQTAKPAIAWFGEVFKAALEGKNTNAVFETIKWNFADARAEAEKTAPAMVAIINAIEWITKWLADGSIKRDLMQVYEAVKAISTALVAVSKVIVGVIRWFQDFGESIWLTAQQSSLAFITAWIAKDAIFSALIKWMAGKLWGMPWLALTPFTIGAALLGTVLEQAIVAGINRAGKQWEEITSRMSDNIDKTLARLTALRNIEAGNATSKDFFALNQWKTEADLKASSTFSLGAVDTNLDLIAEFLNANRDKFWDTSVRDVINDLRKGTVWGITEKYGRDFVMQMLWLKGFWEGGKEFMQFDWINDITWLTSPSELQAKELQTLFQMVDFTWKSSIDPRIGDKINTAVWKAVTGNTDWMFDGMTELEKREVALGLRNQYNQNKGMVEWKDKDIKRLTDEQKGFEASGDSVSAEARRLEIESIKKMLSERQGLVDAFNRGWPMIDEISRLADEAIASKNKPLIVNIQIPPNLAVWGWFFQQKFNSLTPSGSTLSAPIWPNSNVPK